METEQLERHEQAMLDVAWQAYQLWTGTTNETGFRRSYLGHYPSRDAFGQELVHRLGADSRLLQLPDWLRAYLRFDGEAVLRDFEAAGDFWVYDAPDGQGCFVFDPYERPAP